MNNQLRVWDVENGYELKKTIDAIPQEDLNFVEWHPKAPLILTGGKDFMIWLVNAQNGKLMGNLGGHEEEVTQATFSLHDQAKHVVSSSADCTLKVWKPISNECIMTVRQKSAMIFHDSPIICFALHQEKPLCISGDESGKVFASNFITGEISGCIGEHKDTVEHIVISSTLQMAASAGIDNTIHIYDLKDKDYQIRNQVQPTVYGGFTKLAMSEVHPNILLAASTLGDFFLIDPRSGTVIKALKGHAAPINDFVEVKETGTIATAGDDNQCMLFDIKDIELDQ
jgi:WD40 repeat protein